MSARDPRAMRLHPDDDVAVALGELAAGQRVFGVEIVATIASGHKFALHDIAADSPVHKYGQVIGLATTPIRAGEPVHTHNLAFTPSTVQHAVGSNVRPVTPASRPRTFDGYVRSDGKVGTRNYIGILSSVNCSVTVGKLIAQAASPLLSRYPGVDGVVPLGHGTGCGMAEGEGLQLLQRTLRGYAAHPNFAAILVVGLGCEVNQIADLQLASCSPNAQTLVIQDAGGTTAAVGAGLAKVEEMLAQAERCRREPVPLSKLVLGLNCGGSDAYSGITANPALGVAADILASHGGTAVLAETPEIYGAENLLTSRAVSRQVADKLLARIAWWEDYTARNGGTIDSNPSPGNKAGGLTTILEKSLGAVAKGGSSPLQAVYEYAEPVRPDGGLVFMDTPGYDPVSVTGIVAGGAQVVCFTTGRGSVFGCKPAPSIKLCSNPETYARMSDDMDVNCGAILDGARSVEEMGREVFELVVATASGQTTASERLGFGVDEFAPWQLGAVL